MDMQTYTQPGAELLTPEESQRLFRLCAEGDIAARERIIVAYLPFVHKLCRKHEGKGVHFDDLLQEGAYGLIVALGKYDMTRGTSFASHARFYIEKYIRQALITQNLFQPIVYKEDFFYDMQKYIRTLDELTERLDRAPTNTELARQLRTTENKIRILSQSLYTFFPVQDLFIDSSSGACPAGASAEDSVMRHVLDLSCLGVTLSNREKEVLSRRLGFTDSGIPEDISSISAAMGLSYETIRKTYESTLQTLRKAAEERGYTASTIKI